MSSLPSDHKARWFAGAALNAADQAMASVMFTVLSRLNAFLDSELEHRYEATVNAGANAQYYTWNGYVARTGNYIKFSVPVSDVLNWTDKYNGCPKYTSAPITGRGTNTWSMNPTLWTSTADAQQMLTMDYEIVTPTNTIQYSLYVDGIDEGRPGGGGGLYGGSISQTSAVAGGGSGFVGSGTNNSSMTAGDFASLPPDGSSDGYARITLLS